MAAEKNAESNGLYRIKLQKPFGAVINDIDLSSNSLQLSTDLIDKIKADIVKHKLLIFKQQAVESNNIMPADRMVELSKLMGTIHDKHMIHSNSPHDSIYRISNDKEYGLTNVGRKGWHIDGLFVGMFGFNIVTYLKIISFFYNYTQEILILI